MNYMSLPDSWGGQQEIAAAARHWDIQLTVVPSAPDMPILRWRRAPRSPVVHRLAL